MATLGEVFLLKGLDVIEHGLAQSLTKDEYPHPGEVICKFFMNWAYTAGIEAALEMCGITSPDKKQKATKPIAKSYRVS